MKLTCYLTHFSGKKLFCIIYGVFKFQLCFKNCNVYFLCRCLGLVLNQKNILVSIMFIELLFLSVNLNFIIFSIYLNNIFGLVYVLFVLTITISESALD